MSRVEDVRRLYALLDVLQARLRGPRFLRECDGRMKWPARGVYFFFETGEVRSTSGFGPRVVRVGTHALTEKSKTTLWDRLSQHRGSALSGGGNHRGSIFRLLVGEALGRRGRSPSASWGVGSSAGEASEACGLASKMVRDMERPLERVVSAEIGSMPFLWVEADLQVGTENIRGSIERNSIALLSNFGKESIDPPSDSWLGRHSGRQRVRDSGLWNNNHVEESYDPAFLDLLERLSQVTPPQGAR